jgi:hypothetical protein
MDCHPEPIVDTRLSERIALQCSIVMANGRQVGEGRVLDLSVRGCLVEGPVPVKVGDSLQLRLFLPDSDQSMCVSLAAVRWTQDLRFGVEFIEVDEKHRACLNHFVARQADPWARTYD